MKKILRIILIILIVFILVNIAWFSWRTIKYYKYAEGMNKNESYTIFVPKYLFYDKDGFSYSVKYPDYLSFTGNLAISTSNKDYDDYYTDALIIWPNLLKDYEYGLILYDEDNNEYMIEVNKNKEPKDSKYKEIINIHKENIDILFDKANEFWDLN